MITDGTASLSAVGTVPGTPSADHEVCCRRRCSHPDIPQVQNNQRADACSQAHRLTCLRARTSLVEDTAFLNLFRILCARLHADDAPKLVLSRQMLQLLTIAGNSGMHAAQHEVCLLYTSDAADDLLCVD